MASVKGINFISTVDGRAETLTLDHNFSTIFDSPTGVFSVWYCSIRLATATHTAPGFFDLLDAWTQYGPYIEIYTDSMPAISWIAQDIDGNDSSSNAEMVGSLGDARWHHILMSWDRATGKMVMMIDRWSPTVYTQADVTPNTVSYTGINNWEIGGEPGNIAELWFEIDLSLDITDPTVLNKFVTPSGTPTDLGNSGENITGSPPLLYLSVRNDPTEFITNRGWGGEIFTVTHPSGQTPGFAFSDRLPSIENPIRQITGTLTDLTMRSTHYANLDLGYDPFRTQIIFDDGVGAVILNGSGSRPTIFSPPPLFYPPDGLTPTAANFATLNGDGLTATNYALPGLRQYGINNNGQTYAVARGASCVYIVIQNDWVFPPVFYINIFSLTEPMSVIGPLPILGIPWFDAELKARRVPGGRNSIIPFATIVNWAGKEQCVCYFSLNYEDGRVVLCDAAGNFSDAKIWDGFNSLEEYQFGPQGETGTVLTIPNGTHNYFMVITTPQYGVDVPLRIVEADNTGHNLSSFVVHADNLDVDMIIQGGPYEDWGNDDRPTVIWSTDVNASVNNFCWAAADDFISPSYICKLDPACTGYTAYRLVPEDGDAAATHILNELDFVSPAGYFGDDYHYVVYAAPAAGESGILWDGPATSDYVAELKQVNLLPMHALYPMQNASDVFALLAETSLFPQSFSQFSLSLWCCGSVDLRSTYFDDPTIFMQFRTDHVSIVLKNNARNVLFQGTFQNPKPVASIYWYHVAFSVDTQAQKYALFGNGVIWPSSDVTFPLVGDIGNEH